MTVSLNPNPRDSYVTNGSTDTFAFTFEISASGDIEVSKDNVIQANGFTVSSVDFSSGDVIFASNPGSVGASVIVTLRRQVPINRTTDFQTGSVRASTLNTDFDRPTFSLQDLSAFTLKRDNADEYDASTRAIVGVTDPVVDQGVATKFYVDTNILQSGAIPLPASVTDDGKVLTASNGEVDWQTVASAFTVTASQITDSGALGASVLRQATAASIVTVIGLGSVAADITALEASTGVIDASILVLNASVAQLVTDVTALEASTTAIDLSIAALEASTTAIDLSVAALEASTLVIDASILVLNASVAQLVTDVTEINNSAAFLNATNTWGAAQNLADNQLIRAELRDFSENATTVAAAGSTETLDLTVANVFDITMDQDVTFTFSNPPASGKLGSIVVYLRQDGTGGFTPTWPATVDWEAGITPTVTSTAGATDRFQFETLDAGTTWYGFVGGLDLK